MHSFKGLHILAEMSGVSSDKLNNRKYLESILVDGIRIGNATLCSIQSKEFEPHGVTCVAMLAESHATIHTYPEHRIAYIDVFTCGKANPEAIVEHIMSELEPKESNVRSIQRGALLDSFPPAKANDQVDIEETIAPGLSRTWHIESTIFHKATRFQEVLIGKTAQGVSLFCNRERQSTELSQLIYHEGQFIPAALLARELKNVLIIGSSEGVVSKMALECGAEKVVHVDIDQECVELCAQYLPYGYTANDVEDALNGKSNVQLLCEDGFTAVEKFRKGGQKFDVIVMDLPDEDGEVKEAQQNRLYDENYLRQLVDLLTPEGALITQAGCPTYWRNATLKRSWERFSKVFKTSVYFDMPEQDWSWLIGSPKLLPSPLEKMTARLKSLSYTPRFIDEESIRASTILPISVRKDL